MVILHLRFLNVSLIQIVQIITMLMTMFNYVYNHVQRVNLSLVKTVLRFVQMDILEINNQVFASYHYSVLQMNMLNFLQNFV